VRWLLAVVQWCQEPCCGRVHALIQVDCPAHLWSNVAAQVHSDTIYSAAGGGKAWKQAGSGMRAGREAARQRAGGRRHPPRWQSGRS
jgi:hypothetical protein